MRKVRFTPEMFRPTVVMFCICQLENCLIESSVSKVKRLWMEFMVYNKKTALVFFEWKYHTSVFLGRETHGRSEFPGQENR
jgi:hypothetical protein